MLGRTQNRSQSLDCDDNPAQKTGPMQYQDYINCLANRKVLRVTETDMLSSEFEYFKKHCKNVEVLIFEKCKNLSEKDICSLVSNNRKIKRLVFKKCGPFQEHAFEGFRQLYDSLEDIDVSGYPLTSSETTSLIRVGFQRLKNFVYDQYEDISMKIMKSCMKNVNFYCISDNRNRAESSSHHQGLTYDDVCKESRKSKLKSGSKSSSSSSKGSKSKMSRNEPSCSCSYERDANSLKDDMMRTTISDHPMSPKESAKSSAELWDYRMRQKNSAAKASSAAKKHDVCDDFCCSSTQKMHRKQYRHESSDSDIDVQG
uniref:Uncharacterized protein n=1 Tax=Cuerna arida TaxID=1464854 RepID=A0A1B6F5E0_9HEMI